MKRTIKITIILIISIISISLIYVLTYVPKLSEQHGIVETKLFLADSNKQPLIVAFGGGGEGGNDWSRSYLQGKRDTLNNKGYAFLALENI